MEVLVFALSWLKYRVAGVRWFLKDDERYNAQNFLGIDKLEAIDWKNSSLADLKEETTAFLLMISNGDIQNWVNKCEDSELCLLQYMGRLYNPGLSLYLSV